MPGFKGYCSLIAADRDGSLGIYGVLMIHSGLPRPFCEGGSVHSRSDPSMMDVWKGSRLYSELAVNLFKGSVTEPRRTFVTDLVTELRNKTRWLVTHPSLHPSLHTPMDAQTLSHFPWVPAEETFAEHAFC